MAATLAADTTRVLRVQHTGRAPCHPPRNPALAPFRSHEPYEEPYRLQGGGSHRRVYDCHHASLDNSHAHIDDVPLAPPPLCSQAHHPADASLLSAVPDLLGLGAIVPPCMHVDAVKVLACYHHKNVALPARNVKSFFLYQNNHLIIWQSRNKFVSLHCQLEISRTI